MEHEERSNITPYQQANVEYELGRELEEMQMMEIIQKYIRGWTSNERQKIGKREPLQ